MSKPNEHEASSPNRPDDETAYSTEELNEFRCLVEMGESRRQMDRIKSRLEMPGFIKRVGRIKCDVMFEVLKAEFNYPE